MLASVHSLSNPLSAFSRLYYTHEKWINPEKLLIKNHEKKNLEFLIEQALDDNERKKYSGSVEKYLLINEAVRENIHKIKNNDIIWLGLYNLGLESPLGFFKHVNTDDFCTKTDFARYLIEIYMKSDKSVQEAMEQIIFYRHGPFEFPFTIKRDSKGVKIINPFIEEVKKINYFLKKRGKTPLGDNERYYHDDNRLENYNIAASIFSIKKFNEQVNKEPYYLEALFHSYNGRYERTKYVIRNISDFKKLCETAISLNREILRQKYSAIFSDLELKTYDAFMIEGNVANELINGIIKKYNKDLKKHIIGEKLLQNTKNIPIRGFLESQALNRLSGYLNAKYGIPNSIPAIIETKKFHKRHDLFISRDYPYIYAGENTTDIDSEIKEISDEDIKKLENDIIKYQVRISPIEVIIYFLNENNFPVYSDSNKDKTWQNLKKGKVMPLDISIIKDDSARITRPSNCSVKCSFLKYINVVEKNYPFEIKKEDSAVSGSLRHKIANQIGENQKKFLERIGLEAIDRDKYCEVKIKTYYRPKEHDWNITEEFLKKKYLKTENKLYAMALEKITILKDSDTVIDDGGSPDAVLIMDNSPIIVDFKRRVARYYPVPSFFEQAARYGLMIVNELNIDTDRIYTVIVQTPFSSTKYLDMLSFDDTKDFLSSLNKRTIFDKGNYRHEKIRIKEIMLNSNFINKVKAEWISEWIINKHLFLNNESLGMLERQYHKNYLCKNCFANTEKDFRCNYLLTGRMHPWE
ncbi:MAG: hypothetical protein KatS3mg002_0658 [Candidatus Woesearchaeota archaeon]|nr:MAG: hypothetical protein KatS3mg002_0658 [Candidatus Woesearchaeota archaeon]